MASGMGMRGGVSRCFGFFQDLQNCKMDLDAQKADMSREEIAEATKHCHIFRVDYMECLHGEKRVLREQTLKQAEAMAKSGGGHH